MATYNNTGSGVIPFQGVPFKFRRKLTIPSGTTKTLDGFPTLVQVNLGILRTFTNFRVTDANGKILPFELVSYDNERGKLTGYASVNLKYNADVILYLYYG